jgi:hypothetical protein
LANASYNVGYKASCNFTLYGFSENLEELGAFLSWDGKRSEKFISKQLLTIESYLSEEDNSVSYINSEQIETILIDKFGKIAIAILLENEKKLNPKRKSERIIA